MLSITPATPAFVDATELLQLKPTAPYIQRSDLLEVLKDYFSNALDDPLLPEVICHDLRDWHPNSLWCFVDSSLMRWAIGRLRKGHREIIHYTYEPWRCDMEYLQSRYVKRSVGMSFASFLDICFDEAIEELSKLLIQRI